MGRSNLFPKRISGNQRRKCKTPCIYKVCLGFHVRQWLLISTTQAGTVDCSCFVNFFHVFFVVVEVVGLRLGCCSTFMCFILDQYARALRVSEDYFFCSVILRSIRGTLIERRKVNTVLSNYPKKVCRLVLEITYCWWRTAVQVEDFDSIQTILGKLASLEIRERAVIAICAPRNSHRLGE